MENSTTQSNPTKNYVTIGTKEWVLDRTRDFLERQVKWSGIAGGFLLGLFVNALSDPNIHDVTQLLDRMFNVKARPLNLMSWFAIIIVLLFSLGRPLLVWYSRKRSYEVYLAELYQDKVDKSLWPFQRGRIAWGLSLTLQSCPDLHAGWPIEGVRIEHDPTKHVLSSDIDQFYRKYVKTEFHAEYGPDDRTRLMLVENPRAFSDAPTLRLRIRETKWSQVQFYHNWTWKDPSERARHIDQVLRGPINFPNSLCLHMVVVTADDYVLLTRSSPKVDYYPNAWACSIGEQLDLVDLKGPEKRFAMNWAERALWEELGVSTDGFKRENIRAMAVFLESEIVNCAIASIAILNHDRFKLDAIIDKHPRTDYEFHNWDFIHWNDLPKELQSPTRVYHPSTGLRMFYACLYRFGVPGLNRQLVALAGKK